MSRRSKRTGVSDDVVVESCPLADVGVTPFTEEFRVKADGTVEGQETPGPKRPALKPSNVYVSLPHQRMRTLRELSNADLDDLTALVTVMPRKV